MYPIHLNENISLGTANNTSFILFRGTGLILLEITYYNQIALTSTIKLSIPC